MSRLRATNLRHVDLDGAGYRRRIALRYGRDAQPRRYGSRSCSAGTRYWGRRRRSTCARRPRSVVPIAPYARRSACRRFRCRGSERHSVRVETCGTSSCVWEAGSSPSMIASLESGISQTPIAPTRRRGGHIGVVKPSHDRWIDIRRPHRFCYGRPLRYEPDHTCLRLGNGCGFPRNKLHIWTAFRPDAGEQQVRGAVLPILRHFIVAPSGDDRKATENPDFNVAWPHDAIMQAGALTIDGNSPCCR